MQVADCDQEGKVAYEAFDSEKLHIIGNAMDEAWRRVKFNHLKGDANAARSVLASHIFAMARQGERGGAYRGGPMCAAA